MYSQCAIAVSHPTTCVSPCIYSPATKEWKQAHSQARFVLLHVMLNAGEGFVDVKEVCSVLYYHYYYYINYCLL